MLLSTEQRKKVLKLKLQIMHREGYTVEMVKAESEISRKFLRRTEQEIVEQCDYMKIQAQVEEYLERRRMAEMPNWRRWLRNQLFKN